MKDISLKIQRKELQEILTTAPAEAIDLLSKLFTYDPSKRLTAREVLQHPFFADIHNPAYLTYLDSLSSMDYFDFEFEDYYTNLDILRDLILDEVILANSSEANAYYQHLKQKHPNGMLMLHYKKQSALNEQ